MDGFKAWLVGGLVSFLFFIFFELLYSIAGLFFSYSSLSCLNLS